VLDPERRSQQQHELAQALRALREAAKLSGERLAARCAMSQSKISRIERGRLRPKLDDVERILTALNAPTETVARVMRLARVATIGYTSKRADAERGLWRTQDDIAALVASSAMVRQFMPGIPSALLQTEEYARATLTPVVPGAVARNVEKTVEARLAAQAGLDDLGRRFVFVLTEQAVRWPRVPRDVRARQVAHLAALSNRPNIDMAVLAPSVDHDLVVEASPLNYFVIYDDRLSVTETSTGTTVVRDPKDLAYLENLFDYFLSKSLRGDDATVWLSWVASEIMRQRN